MALFNQNRFPIESCNQNIQWNNSPVHPSGGSNCVQPFQRPPTPTVRPQQFEGFPQYSGHNRPPFSNVPPPAHPSEFNSMLPPNNQVFNMNVMNTPQNFSRMPGAQSFHGANNSHNFPGAPGHQNIPRVPGEQNFPGASNVQNFSGAPSPQGYPGAPSPQSYPGAPPQSFHGAPNPQVFPAAPSFQNLPGAPNPQNFHGAPGPQNFPGAPNFQNLPGAPSPQQFPAAPNLQNLPGLQSFPRPPDPQNFPRMPDPQNMPRPPDPQHCQKPPNFQNFQRPSDPQNFQRPPNFQNFQRPPDLQNFQRPPNFQNFPRPPDHQNFPRNPNPQNFPNQANHPRDSNQQNFSRAPDSLNFPRANLEGFQRMPGPQNFTGSLEVPQSPRKYSARNHDAEPSFDRFHQMSSSSSRPFTPWKRFSTGNEKTPFQNQSWKGQSRDYSMQENRRGNSKFQNFKKLKEDNREKPFSCDTCDRAFVTETDLEDHISQHITCDHANCTFRAHPKVVALHKKMQHDTGYADRINKLKDAEEIKKWREERKRRFPTAENIKKRQAEQAEREARGEVLETKEFGKFKRRKEDCEVNSNNQRRRGQRFKRRNDRRRNFVPRSQTFPHSIDSETDSDSDSHITLHRFPGMLSSASKDLNNKDSTCSEANSTSISNHHSSQNLSEQNLSKSQLEDNFSQSDVPCSENNSNNEIKDKTIKLNDDKLNDATSSSVIKAFDDKSENEQNITTIEDSDDEAPVAEPIVKCVEKSILMNQELTENKDINVSVCEIPCDKSEMEQNKNVELVQVADSDDEAPTVVPINKSFDNLPPEDEKSNQNKAVQENLPESSKDQGKVVENGYNRNNNRHNRYSRNQQHGQNIVQVARKSSLLEKLLADDIRHERNVILQCIRHIVKNNFFGIENNSHK